MTFDCLQGPNAQSRLRFIVFVLAFISFLLSIISIQGCTFILSGTSQITDIPELYGWGIFTTPVYDKERHIQGCIAYPSSVELGSSMKTAQAFGVLMVIFAGLNLLGLILSQFFLDRDDVNEAIYHVIRVFLPSSFCCELLTFSAFASPFCDEIMDKETGIPVPASCIPGDTGAAAIFNLVAIIVMTTLMTFVTPPPHPVFQLYNASDHGKNVKPEKKKRSKKEKEEKVDQVSLLEPRRPGRDQVKTTIVTGPQVRKTIKEITHPDGTQTITTTIEEMQPVEKENCVYEYDDGTIIEII